MERLINPACNDTVKRLFARNVPTIPERLWSAVSGQWYFDGSVIRWDGDPYDKNRLVESLLQYNGSEDNVIVWLPRQRHRRQRGRLPKCLWSGFTVCLDGTELVAFQSVVIVPRSITELVATTPSGQFVLIPAYKVSSWDGVAIDAPASPLS